MIHVLLLLPLQAKDLSANVRLTQPKVADKVDELLARARALQQRMMKQLLERW